MSTSSIELIGVPFDGFGRVGHQARAAETLRDAGLEGAFGDHDVLCGSLLALPPPDPARATRSGLMNEAAMLAMVDGLHRRVGAALAADRFPIVYGGECSVLLGTVSGVRDARGRAGLVFVDGHEDTTPLDVSEDGEAANMEIGLLLGITGQLAPAPLRRRLPALEPAALAMLGPRDHELRRRLNVASLADLGVHLRGVDAVTASPADAARGAVQHVRQSVSAWWLHTDLDVVAQDIFTAGRVPGDNDERGGLDWAQLTELTTTALASGGCAGWSIVIYDPEQDPDGTQAGRIVEFVTDVAAARPNRF
jgi:arginase